MRFTKCFILWILRFSINTKGRVGIVPLLNHQAYWFISINAKAQDPKYKAFGKPHLQARFNHFPNEVRVF